MIKFVVCAATLALSVPVLAHAAPGDDTMVSAKVGYADLNLSRPKDATVMLNRLQSAALEACGASRFSVPDYRAAVQRSGCYWGGLDRAVADLNSPAVTQLYRSHPVVTLASTGRAIPTGG